MANKFTKRGTLIIGLCSLIAVALANSAEPPPLYNPLRQSSNTLTATHNDQNTPNQPPNGRRISLNFNNIQTRRLLQILAQFTGHDFVISDKVTSSMSIHLQDISWRQALKVILKAQSLGMHTVGKTTIIAPAAEIEQQQIAALQTTAKLNKLKAAQPLTDKIITLKYAKATEIGKLLTEGSHPLVSTRGQVNVDARTNSLWIRDTSTDLSIISRMIKKLDFPERQVMIEARIVSIQRPFERQIGARFGVSTNKHLSGTLSGANQIAGGTAPSGVTPVSDRLNFNVPVTNFLGNLTPASVGIALAKLGKTFIDLEISALEQEGKVDLISSPRLITSNQHPAYIKTGTEVPYQVSTSSGATAIEFKEAVLRLEVTPLITPDDRILLTLEISNNTVGTPIVLTGAAGNTTSIPIDTEEEKSRVILENNQTVVLGGVYKRDKRKTITRVPFLGQIPLVGHLFRHTFTRDSKTELIIFLTPHIIDKPSQIS